MRKFLTEQQVLSSLVPFVTLRLGLLLLELAIKVLDESCHHHQPPKTTRHRVIESEKRNFETISRDFTHVPRDTTYASRDLLDDDCNHGTSDRWNIAIKYGNNSATSLQHN